MSKRNWDKEVEFAQMVAAMPRAYGERDVVRLAGDVIGLRDALAAKQAEIDRLMVEFCPEEMSPEQTAAWAAHQAPAPFDDQFSDPYDLLNEE